MIRTSVVLRLALSGLLILSTGCTLYQPRPVTFTVRDAETRQPIEGATLQTQYLQIMDFGSLLGSVGPMSGTTDRDGKLTLVVDPEKRCFFAEVSAGGYPAESFRASSGYPATYQPRPWYQLSQNVRIDLYKDPTASAEFILPDGYRGPVVVYFSPTDVPPAQAGQREFTYSVSARGAVNVPQSGLLENPGSYSHVRARYPGTPSLTTITEYPNLQKDPSGESRNVVAFRFLAVDWEKHARIYFVGTHAEAEALFKQVWPDNNHEDQKAFDRILAEHPRP